MKSKKRPEPLSLRELTNLIDGAELMHREDEREESPTGGLALGPIQSALDAGGSPEHYLDFVTVSSEFYPTLEEYYDHRIRSWLERLAES